MHSPIAANPTRTKLIATLGPATASADNLEGVLTAGVDVCRLNFSHGELEEHSATLERVRAWARAHDRHIAVLGDLCGPKIRLGRIRGGTILLKAGDQTRFVRGDAYCDAARLTTNYDKFIEEVDVGQRVYIDDGLIRLLVVDKEPDAVVCNCTVGGVLTSRKGVNLPDARLSAAALTEKDLSDLRWAIERRLDFVALSFARRPEDLDQLFAELRDFDHAPGVIVKIEKIEALEHLPDFIARASGIMVARGDLGVEMDVWQVPLIQKAITAHCREVGKPVIVATQMLQSMVVNPTPTRAEVSDVANAILDGADAVMLSAETAAGEFPVAAVEMMARVACATEAYPAPIGAGESDATAAIGNARMSATARAAVQAARSLDARLVAVWTTSGEAVRLVAKARLQMPVVGLTADESVCRRMNLLYGVIPIRVEPMRDPTQMAAVLDEELTRRGLARRGDLVVVVTSTHPTVSGATNVVLLRRVGEQEGDALESPAG